ncbi:hypothetical protein VIGAN_02184700, partial [Vigna angularis var. angularis]
SLFNVNSTDPKGCELCREHRTICLSSTDCDWLETQPGRSATGGLEMQIRALSQMVCVEDRRHQREWCTV